MHVCARVCVCTHICVCGFQHTCPLVGGLPYGNTGYPCGSWLTDGFCTLVPWAMCLPSVASVLTGLQEAARSGAGRGGHLDMPRVRGAGPCPLPSAPSLQPRWPPSVLGLVRVSGEPSSRLSYEARFLFTHARLLPQDAARTRAHRAHWSPCSSELGQAPGTCGPARRVGGLAGSPMLVAPCSPGGVPAAARGCAGGRGVSRGL